MSPDGRFLATHATTDGGRRDVALLVDLDHATASTIPGPNAATFAWSKDSRRLWYITTGTTSWLMTYRPGVDTTGRYLRWHGQAETVFVLPDWVDPPA